MARKRKLKTEDRAWIEEQQRRVAFYGTPEKGYTDSGLWEFLQYVRTKDEHDHENPIKPLDWEKYQYAQVVFLHWLALGSMYVPKSRQVRMSWLAVIFAAWFVRTAPHRLVMFQSLKEEDANKMVSLGAKDPVGGRLSFIEHHLPWWLQDPNIISGRGNMVGELVYTPEMEGEGGVKVHWHGSRVLAVPQGANQIRGKVPSLYMADEAGLWDDFRECWSSAGMAVQSGGAGSRSKMFALSSVYAGGQFNESILDGAGGDGEGVGINYGGIPEMSRIINMLPGKRLPRGMRSFVTGSGMPVLEVHYSVDPDKRPDTPVGKHWIDTASKRYIGGTASPDWLREMEIDYEASGGSLVFPQIMDPKCKVWHPALTLKDIKRMKLRLVGGYDYGSVNPAAFIVWGIAPDGKRYAVWEMYEPVVNYVEHAQKIRACPYVASGMIEKIVCDPQMMAKDQQTESGKKSMLELFRQEGVFFHPGRKGADTVLVQLLRYWWRDIDDPEAFICENCWNLKREMQRLKWKEYSGAVAKRRNLPEEIEDKNNHAFDASAYILDTQPKPPRLDSVLGGGMTWGDVDREMRREEDRQKNQHLYI